MNEDASDVDDPRFIPLIDVCVPDNTLPASRLRGHPPHVIPTSAVTVVGSRFKPGPHQYVIQPPYGDGETRYDTRDAAMKDARHEEEK